jgi:catechol 2,3-dioxygenase-like lactoylglutathione lyase family enzyme
VIRYLTLGSNDIPRARKFYDAVLATVGHARIVDTDTDLSYGPPKTDDAGGTLWIVKPFMALPATWGNGTMVAFEAVTRSTVDQFHAAAIANGGTDDGAPGLRRYSANFYACYVRDPDGNKLSAVCAREE